MYSAKCMCLAVWMAHSLVCFGFDITFHSNLFSLQCSGTFVIVWLICTCKFVSTLCVLFGGSVSDLRLWCLCSPYSLCLSGFGKVVIVRPGNFVLPWASPVVHRRVHPVCLRFTQRGLFEIRAPLGWTGFTSCLLMLWEFGWFPMVCGWCWWVRLCLLVAILGSYLI